MPGVIILLGMLLAACGRTQATPDLSEAIEPPPAPTVQVVPTDPPLPDLVFTRGEWGVEGFAGDCVDESAKAATTVCVQNQGEGDAGPFVVRALHRQGGDAFTWDVDGLGAGEEICLEAEGRATGRTTADVNDAVAESDEANNHHIVPLVSAPPVCTPTPLPTASPTPLPLAAPTATPFPEGSKVKTEVFPIYNCRYLGNDIYEWYRAEVTYVNGEQVGVEIIRGPFMGDWQGGCPSNPPEPEG